MPIEDSIELWVAGIAGAALIVATLIKKDWGSKPAKTEAEKARNNRAFEATHTPASPGGDDLTVTGLVSLANQVGVMRDELKATRKELSETSVRVTTIERSYTLLYQWAQKIIKDWDELRHQEKPLPLPHGIHHPE